MTVEAFRNELEKNRKLREAYQTAVENGSGKAFLSQHGVEVPLGDNELEGVAGGAVVQEPSSEWCDIWQLIQRSPGLNAPFAQNTSGLPTVGSPDVLAASRR